MVIDIAVAEPRVSAPDAETLNTARPRRRRRPFQPGLVLAVSVVALVLAWTFFPGVFTNQDPILGDPIEKFQAPSAEHWFGTDSLGRDLYTRVVYGSALSLAGTLVATLVGLTVGSLLGLLAGYLRGVVDAAIMRVVDILLAIPGFLLSLALVTALGFGTVNVAIAVGIASIASFARIMRSEVITVRSRTFVEAAALSGTRWYDVLRLHVLPNSAGPVLALAALEFGTAVLAISGLSFLGFGAPPPAPEWGSLVSDGRNYLASAWWLTTFPGLVVAGLVLAANRISRAFETGKNR